jgi:hypothetical protein
VNGLISVILTTDQREDAFDVRHVWQEIRNHVQPSTGLKAMWGR